MSLSDDFNIIHCEVIHIHETWNIVSDLFGKETDLKVLDESGARAWMLIRNALVDSIVLGLTRLITDHDSSKHGPKMRLQRVVDAVSDSQMNLTLETQLADLRSALSSIKEHRDNRIAHWDHEYAQEKKSLPRVTFDDVKDALNKLRAFMNTVYEARENSYFAYEHTRAIGDGQQVLGTLRDGLRLRRLRDAAWDGSTSEKEILDELRKWPDQYSPAG